MILTWASATDTGLVRDHNEDWVAPRDMGVETGGSFVIGVADGMGGHVGGEVASRVALQAALDADGDAVRRVRAANEAVSHAAQADPGLRGMGTTLTLALFERDTLEIGHVGDSRAYLLRDGDLRQVTTDHSVVAEMVARGEISPEEADNHPYRNVITRALGLEPGIEVDREWITLRDGDVVLLASDGLSSMVGHAEIRDLLLSEDNPADAVWTLVDAANASGGVDNISVVVVAVGDDDA